MDKKMNAAFIYRECPSLDSGYFFTSMHHFFMNALRRNDRLSVTYFPSKEVFDATGFDENFNAIILASNQNITGEGVPEKIIGIEKLKIPVLCNTGDVQDALQFDPKIYHEKYKIDYYFEMYSDSWFHKFYPQKFNFKTVYIGLEPSLYKNLKPFDSRIKTSILNSGNIGRKKFTSKLYNLFMKRGYSNYDYYKLRTDCNNLPYVDYTPTLQHEYIGDKYPKLLEKYASAIAATSMSPSRKYLEIPAAGCLTFMEVTAQNYAQELGFVDNETAIFINENNYESKFEDFISDPQNDKWKEIAANGQDYALNNLSNDVGVNQLADLIQELI
jgi:hypothetical protein